MDGFFLVRVQPVPSHELQRPRRAEELLPARVHGHRAAPIGNDDEGAAGLSPERTKRASAGRTRAARRRTAPSCLHRGPRPQSLVLHTDEHRDYPRAIARASHLDITHRTISSRAARTPANPIFSVNLNDMLTRHTGANHKRETIAFPKRRQMAIWRMAVFMVWRNYMKWASERRRHDTPAMRPDSRITN